MNGLSDTPCLRTRTRGGRVIRCGCALLSLSIGLAYAAPVLAQEGQAPNDAATQERAEAPSSLKAGAMDVPALPDASGLPEVEPVIDDEEFNSRVPDLSASKDPELDKPLESIADFERRMAGEAESEGAFASEVPGQTVQSLPEDAQTVSQIEGAPIRDSELSEPLPPLDQFEVTPVEFAEEGSDEEQGEVRYRVELDGLESADAESPTAIKSMFNSLSVLEKGDGKANNTAMVSARLEEDAQLLQTLLEAEGWYTPRIRTRLAPARDSDEGDLTARISVVPGQRFTFSDIVIKADPTEPQGLIADNMPLKLGEPIVAQRVQGAEARVAVALPQNGYPFAKVGQRDILLDRDTGDGVYTLPVTIGPRGRFGGITTDGDTAFDAEHVGVLARFEEGDLYDSRMVDDLRKALIGTSLFSTVAVEPEQTGEVLEDGTEAVRLHVKQEKGPARTIAGSLGYAAGEGITAQAAWTHRNMFPPEGAVSFNAILGTQQMGLGSTFRRSNAGQRDRTLELTAEGFYNDYDAYDAYTGRLAARISRDSTPLWQKRLTYGAGVELIGTAETDYRPETGDRSRRTYYIAGVNGQLGWDTSDSLLDPTKGFRLTTLIQPEATLNKGFNPYLRARIDGSAYYPVTDSLVIAGRVRFGTIQGVGLFDLAPSRRLYAGGGGSVRGFSYQGLGEQAPDDRPVGGRSLNEGSIEARYRFGNYGVVAFVDAGQAYRETMPQFNDIRYGVGIGGRFYTNFGPMRFDVATPINRRPGESSINVYVSIGQAF
ncbi:autotransporter assembly complex family protein [Novosphingobium sp. BW1]|uniref:autotransporter assembly complex protein TamA n=1 Tax=Novosphingobium sp. BW1 TaxID=2592621 RepID=UPI0011DEBD13|nr:BamA/TamA family outer membrane protein [Novosphingobium sp. BW1]